MRLDQATILNLTVISYGCSPSMQYSQPTPQPHEKSMTHMNTPVGVVDDVCSFVHFDDKFSCTALIIRCHLLCEEFF